nr:class II aldolase/adducin family protein [Spiroplasma clarkii]
MKPEDICVVDLNGKEVECKQKTTSEIAMHLEIYRQRADVNAVIHSHAKYSTIFAVLHKELQPILHVFGFAGTKTVQVAPYATYGTKKMAEVVCQTLGPTAYNVLLANHGNLSVGVDIESTYNVLEELEFCAEIQWKAECIGKPELISDAEIDNLINKFYHEGY